MKISAPMTVLSDHASPSAIWFCAFGRSPYSSCWQQHLHSSLCGCCYRAYDTIAGNDLGSAFDRVGMVGFYPIGFIPKAFLVEVVAACVVFDSPRPSSPL